MRELLLGVDIGTSACKVAVFNKQGEVIASGNGDYQVYYPHPGWAEQNPDEWWSAVCSAIGDVLRKGNIKPEEIKGIGVDGQSWSAIPIDKDGNVIANGNNQVLLQNDPTAHAEIVAIRNACKVLNTYDLSDYILYTSCEPCPMCLSAIIWSNIKTVYYGCTKKDAGEIGFRDDIIYDYLSGKNNDLINLQEMDRNECIKTFEEYKKQNGVIY